jgi:TPR repeat protein
MTEVITLLTTAGNQGHADAQVHISHIYQHGQGVAKDYEEAVRWVQKAAEQGFVHA